MSPRTADRSSPEAVDSGGTFGLGSRRVRRVGYGAMQLAGNGFSGPPRDRDEALRVLCAAVAGRVDHIDTAQFYGSGTVNGLIREALHPYPAGLAIVSKVAVGHDTRAADLHRGIEDNLRALGLDRLAAVNLRVPDPFALPDRGFDAQLASLVKAREQGLAEGVGLSNISRQHLLRALEQTEVVCVQNLFHLLDQRSLDVLEECAQRGIAFVPYCPLGWPLAVRQRILDNPVLAELGTRLAATPTQVALAWLLDLAPNVLLIPGTRTRAHLAENLRAGDVVLDDDARAELQRSFPARRTETHA
ncbi:aldo/keto reductase [Amycolatopsis sp. NBC_01488]|uniref:aldo/keto reductase n=1 Tax=Amycolatopsis sp. NBC_01488 TaxID=2903563 RepID=UPI002E2DEBFF|nr:aldo/keto reductase [Amycolatopsis sp. NBC_01488]